MIVILMINSLNLLSKLKYYQSIYLNKISLSFLIIIIYHLDI